jgi:hypothetical protein
MISDFFIAAYQKHLDMTSFWAGDTHDSKQLFSLEDFESISSLAQNVNAHMKNIDNNTGLYYCEVITCSTSSFMVAFWKTMSRF